MIYIYYIFLSRPKFPQLSKINVVLEAVGDHRRSGSSDHDISVDQRRPIKSNTLLLLMVMNKCWRVIIIIVIIVVVVVIVMLRLSRHFHANQGHEVGLLALHVGHLSLGLSQLGLKLCDLLLEVTNRTRAPVNRVPDSRASLIHHTAHRVGSLTLRELLNFIIKNKY